MYSVMEYLVYYGFIFGLMNGQNSVISYFSMEIGLGDHAPTYCGGLGILARDTVRAAADLKLPLVAFTLVYHHGYFSQRLDDKGQQHEEPAKWPLNDFLSDTGVRTSVEFEGRKIDLRIWRYDVKGASGGVVPVYLLDSQLPSNTQWDQTLTDTLYGGDTAYRLAQEVILGVGGLRALSLLGYKQVRRYHMNEGHAAFLPLELAGQLGLHPGTSETHSALEQLRARCVFTTHTPVEAGHDRFSGDLLRSKVPASLLKTAEWFGISTDPLNMTEVALELSGYVNGVAKRHREVSQELFPNYTIDSITNGVHAASWVSPPMREVLDRHVPGWQGDNSSLRYALSIPSPEVWEAHQQSKAALLEYTSREAQANLDVEVFTVGFARRMTAYKRPDLIFHDIERLRAIAAKSGGLQLIFAGKAHPHDRQGRELIQRVFSARDELRGAVEICYLENYDQHIAAKLVAGVDLWLNNPLPPLEASGTSGMKAAVNAVPSLSTYDGWWIEGALEGLTGWTINGAHSTLEGGKRDRADADSLYNKLSQEILPLYYDNREGYIEVMRRALAINGSFFTAERMVREYVLKAYF